MGGPPEPLDRQGKELALKAHTGKAWSLSEPPSRAGEKRVARGRMSLPLGRLGTRRQERACHQPINKAAEAPSICVYLSGLEFPVEMSSSPGIKRQALEGGLASLPPPPPPASSVRFLWSPFLEEEEAALSLNTGSRRFLGGPGGEGMPPGMGVLESLPFLPTGAQPS